MAITFPPATIGLAGVPLYPTQPLEALGSLAIFAFLWFVLRHRRTFRGEVLFAFAILYSILRFMLEFWRADPRGFAPLFSLAMAPGLTADSAGGLTGFLLWAGTLHETAAGSYAVSLSESQLLSVAITMSCVALWVWKSRRDRRLGVSVAPAPLTPAPTAGKVQPSKTGKAKRR
jgi:prolipoprotein diacylglyceryltransferase